MNCPYYRTSDKTCLITNATTSCGNELILAEYGTIINDQYVTDNRKYHCPMDFQELGTKEDVELLFLLHKRMGLITLDEVIE